MVFWWKLGFRWLFDEKLDSNGYLKKTRIPDERGAYGVDAALDFIDSMWTRQVYFKLHFENSTACSGPTIVKGPRMGTLKWEEKRHSSSLKTQAKSPESKFSKKFQHLDCFSLRGTYSEYSYSIAVSMLEYVLHDNFDNLLSRYVFEPLDMVG